MGAVYVAEQASTGKRRAIKVMHPALVADPSLRERFVQEAKVGGLIASDHVVEVVGAGVDPTLGVPWIAMELLEGEDLGHYLPGRGPMSMDEALSVLRPLCHALAAAHAAGIVHRDVKPENVFLAATHSTTHPTIVKVLDFGIAKVAAQARQTATAAMGTPLWMAPEQTELSAKVSPATDVWSIGLIAYWLLTGRAYWRAAHAAEASMPALMREILFEPLEAPSVRAAELGLADRLPPGFDDWFARCTVRDPALRYATAGEAFAALLGTLGLPVSSTFHPPPMPSSSSIARSVIPPTAPSPMGGTLPLSEHQASERGVTAASVERPAAATAAPTSRALPEPKKSRGGLIFALIGAACLLLAVGVVGGFLLFRPGHRVRRPPRPVVARTFKRAPRPPPEVAPEPSAAPTKRTAPRPAAKKKPELPPFDATEAQRNVKQQSQFAAFGCKSMSGPSALSATVVFAPAGHVKTVQMSIKDTTTPRGQCYKVRLLSTRVSPFSGEAQSVGASVSFSE